MLFKITSSRSIRAVEKNWSLGELELERYLVAEEPEAKAKIMSASVFGEPLLIVRSEARTTTGKRADILALDQAGRGVIIELKKDAAKLGVETQALQYLADFSQYRGRKFLQEFTGNSGPKKEAILGFLGNNADIDDINSRNRVILLARSFDKAIFALGEWLSSKGVAFRCVSYLPVQIARDRFLSFSVVFDRSPDGLYPLTFGSAVREPGIYWHNIAKPDESWWTFLVDRGQIPACFDNQPGDPGEKLLAGYILGDRVVAYAKGYGAIGWGVIENPNTYQLVKLEDKDDFLKGPCRHRLNIEWKAVAKKLDKALPAREIRRDFDIYHPISTSVSMDKSKGEKLLARLSRRFGSGS